MSDPEAEYEAAKALFLAAQQRLHAAKAAMKPIWKARETAKQQALIARQAKAAEAFLAGASHKDVAVLGGRTPGYCRWGVSGLLRDLWHSVLSHEEIYRLNGDCSDDGWERRVTEVALARYREKQAA